MAKSWETFEHTADVGIEARGDSLGELMEALGEAMGELICPFEEVEGRRRRALKVESEDVEALAVDFLSEVLSVVETDRFLLHQIRVPRASTTHVEAELFGEPYGPDRHELGTEVKAVTYHQLEVRPEGNRWVGRVILDV